MKTKKDLKTIIETIKKNDNYCDLLGEFADCDGLCFECDLTYR